MSEKTLDHPARARRATWPRSSRPARATTRFVQAQAAIARRMYQLHGTHRGSCAPTSARRALEIVEPHGAGDVVQVDPDRSTASRRASPSWWRCTRSLEARLDPGLPRSCSPSGRRPSARYAAANVPVPGARQGHRARTSVTESLSHLRDPEGERCRSYEDWGDILTWLLREAPPGQFPFTAGVFPLKREGEDPARMFAGEGGPERTNRRFHYVSRGLPAKRLSTAFDSVTLYGEDPDRRPDIYGKVGNSGVSHRQRRRRQEALLRLRPRRSRDLGVDDHQRSGADAARLLPQRRDRPAVREAGSASRARPTRSTQRIDEHLRRARRAAPALPGRRSPRATTASASCCSA